MKGKWGNPNVYGGFLLSENLRKSNLSQVVFFYPNQKIFCNISYMNASVF